MGYGSLKIHGEKFNQIEAVGWVAPGLRICGQVTHFGLFLSASLPTKTGKKPINTKDSEVSACIF